MSVLGNIDQSLGKVVSVRPDACLVKIGRHVEAYNFGEVPAAVSGDASPGDIVFINSENRVQIMWRVRSRENVIIATNACNQRCRFCPQPLSVDIEERFSANIRLLDLLGKNDIASVIITGGEPTVLEDKLIVLVKTVSQKNRKASITLLTNGMKFENIDFAREFVGASNHDTRICIPLHSDAASIHDYITSVSGSFERTVLGLLNLAHLKADIEIRVVLSKLNVERLPDIALSIANNFPFVAHVAFMGMELHASAADRTEEVWIDPTAYMQGLDLALFYLRRREIPVSIYNLPFCLVPSSLWPYLRDSISSWKKTYAPVCEGCTLKSKCPGLFGTSKFQSPNIHPYIKT